MQVNYFKLASSIERKVVSGIGVNESSLDDLLYIEIYLNT
jgi:hypothetical protein